MHPDLIAELADPGCLHAGINTGNPLLVTGRTATGDPTGVAPGMAAAIAERLGIACRLVPFATPGEVADAVSTGAWDIAFIGAEPSRAETIAFSTAYVEIAATYLVPEGSPLQSVDEVDRPGVRIAVSERSAYDLYLARMLKHAQLCRAKGIEGAFELFVSGRLDALAGLRPALNENAADLPGSRVLPGHFTTVQQAIGTRPQNTAIAKFVQDFVDKATHNGLVAGLIERHGVTGRLQVAGSSV